MYHIGSAVLRKFYHTNDFVKGWQCRMFPAMWIENLSHSLMYIDLRGSLSVEKVFVRKKHCVLPS